MKKRVLVAMSGGVDSSVTAALLIQQGMAVEGVTMKLTAGLCCDIGSAQAACHHLGIPHRMIDAQESFSRDIVQDFISEYRLGRTPNPCIKCNDLIKFQLLLSYARENGFDALATGHYARVEPDLNSSRYLLKKGIDAGKDQSYFLYRLTQEQLGSILFPLGKMEKTAVRALARELRLPAAERPESQEICFVADNDYRAFLRENAPETICPGEVVLTNGTVIGKHNGIAFFTVGQRRHLGVSAGERLYVVRIEQGANRVVLGGHEELERKEMMVSNASIISGEAISPGMKVMTKIRYRSPLAPAIIGPNVDDRIKVSFERPVVGVCPGQAAVFSDGDRVLGGGVIDA